MIKNEVIRARVSKQEKEKYMKFAESKGMKISNLIRTLLNKEIEKENR
ncbi:plasmid mobilization protein [Romboutsia ilealis]|uniref:Uncharacterized protein n=1 Tax=Romboutsia ilealis TaxID=1115758 RepID=A0A1V1HZ53_9FIRM|nr:hypothetical protein [Romboutsia ilealis]CED93246.1 Hypothetical protein CRIB_491 [Romboutsia ilealis]